MEESEQLPETTSNEELEIAENVDDVSVNESKMPEPASSDDESEAKENPAITELQATIKIEGQEFEIEAALAQDDKLLKTILQPHFASVENANITREVRDGKLSVTIVKKAQHKGADGADNTLRQAKPFEILCELPEQINPAIILAEEMMRKRFTSVLDFDEIELAEQTLEFSRNEIQRVETQFAALTKTPAAPSLIIPSGF